MNQMKSMKAPKIEIRAEMRYVVRVAGKEMESRYRQVGEMCGMKELRDERGCCIVVDTPDEFGEVLNRLFGTEEYTKVSLIKASPQVIEEMEEIIAEARHQISEPVRTPVVARKMDIREGKMSKGGTNEAPAMPPPSEPPKGQGGKQ